MEKVNEPTRSNQIIEVKAKTEASPEATTNTIATDNIQSQSTSKIDSIKTAKKNIQEQFSSVSINADHKKLIGVLVLAAITTLIYFLFFSEVPNSSNKKEDYDKKIEAKKDKIVKESISLPKVSGNDNVTVVQPAKLPDPLPIVDPTPPAPPPAPVPVAPPVPIISNDNKSPPPPIITATGTAAPVATPAINPFDSSIEERKKMLEKKRKAGIMVTGSGKGGADSIEDSNNKKDKDRDQKKAATKKDFLGFGNGSLDKESTGTSSAPQVVATRIPNLDRTILQGKIINSVLETAINTDIPGTLRAIITRDVYSESGNNVLIPKASRLIGSYESEVKAGQTRLSIIWNRLIRPDGVDIAIDSAGTDALGRAGVAGQVDNKFISQLMNAFLVSYIIPIAAQQLGGNSQITTTTAGATTSGTTTTTTGSAKDLALRQAANDFSKYASDTVKNSFSSKPTITIDQGTVVNILVQKDLIFPADAAGGRLVLP